MTIKKKKLTSKQEMFCQEYLKDLNGTQSALRAGYSVKTAKDIAGENLSKPIIKERIEQLKAKRVERIDIDADYVLKRLSEIDQMDVADILNPDFTVKSILDWPDTWRKTISGIDVNEIMSGGDTAAIIKKIKWPDKVKNLELIGRHVGVQAFKDKVESETTLKVDSPLSERLTGGSKH